MATVRIDYFGMEGEGRTVTEAKRDAGAKIERAMSGNYTPEIIESRGTAILLWRSPYGWHRAIIADANGPRTSGDVCWSSGTDDRLDAKRGAIADLAQLTWDGVEMLPPCLQFACGSRQADIRQLHGEFRHWRGFQLAYQEAKRQGMDEGAIHQWACWHGDEFADKEVAPIEDKPAVAS